MTEVDAAWFDDDDRLLAELGAAMRAEADVPPGFLDAARAAFAWHNVDTELARLVDDSAAGAPLAAGMRSSASGVRSMAFATAALTIEFEVHPDALRGQVVPAAPGRVRVRIDDESNRSFPVDEFGWFVVTDVPDVPFRLRVEIDGGPTALTEWISL